MFIYRDILSIHAVVHFSFLEGTTEPPQVKVVAPSCETGPKRTLLESISCSVFEAVPCKYKHYGLVSSLYLTAGLAVFMWKASQLVGLAVFMCKAAQLAGLALFRCNIWQLATVRLCDLNRPIISQIRNNTWTFV